MEYAQRIICLWAKDRLFANALVEELRLGGDYQIHQAAEEAEALIHLQSLIGIDAILYDNSFGLDSKSETITLLNQREDVIIALGNSNCAALIPNQSRLYGLEKPFYLKQVFQKLNQAFHQSEAAYDKEKWLGDCVFMPMERKITDPISGKSQELTDKEVLILQHLIRMAEIPSNRDELLARIWGYLATTSTHTLETHIYRLRQKLDALPLKNPPTIITEANGYRLILGN